MKYLPIILLLVLALSGCQDKDKKFERSLDTSQRFENAQHRTQTPKGTKVRSEQPTTPEDLAAIDEGLQMLFDKSIAIGYNRNRNTPLTHNQYEVALLIPGRTFSAHSGLYSPDIEIYAQQYAGTEWANPCTRDASKTCIWMAGQVLRFGEINQGGPYDGTVVHQIVAGDHDRDFSRLATLIMYEGEHIILGYENGQAYEETKTHGAGRGHPLFEAPTGLADVEPHIVK